VDWESPFGEAELTVQRLALFLRAVVDKRELIVLDEAFSGTHTQTKDRCLQVLNGGFDRARQALVAISHDGQEVPEVDRWVKLPERGSRKRATFGIVQEELVL
jgi:ABC-type molybdenum transport system ATPase subunit/photorepair protein PhrA